MIKKVIYYAQNKKLKKEDIILKVTIIIFLFCFNLVDAKTLEVNLDEKYETKNYITYTVAHELNETVNTLSDRVWTKDKKSFNTVKYANNAYWAKLQIHNNSNITQNYYLKAENQFTYKMNYYLVEKNKIIKHIEDGVISKNHHRKFNTNHMLFPVEIKAKSQITVYFKIRNYNKININFTLVTKDYLLNYYQSYNIVEGIFFGGMLLMILYNLFLYFLLHMRVRAYVYYVSYVFWLSVYFLGIFGFSERYFEEYYYVFYISSGAFFIFLTLFVQSILNLKKKLPKIHKYLNFFIIYFIITTFINIYVLEYHLFFYAQVLFNISFVMVSIFVFIIIGSTYYLAYVKKDTIAYFYAVVWSIIAIFSLLLPVQYLNIFQFEIPSNYIFQFLILLEALLFSFILAYKINLIENEKKEQERLLVQQNKLVAMGEVISMIAHQWRQPLSEINGIILNMDVDYQKKQLENENFTNYLDNIEKTTQYMSETINDFIDYFKHTKEKEEFTLSELIKGTLNLIASSHEKAISIQYIKPPNMTLFSYRSELVQSLLIVLNNAIDACSVAEQSREAEIKIETNISGKYIIISIKDNGGGIPNEIKNKIYDPYFTTKHKSKGTGLGLYILKMIIEERIQGKIEIKSSNSGTICNILMPTDILSSK